MNRLAPSEAELPGGSAALTGRYPSGHLRPPDEPFDDTFIRPERRHPAHLSGLSWNRTNRPLDGRWARWRATRLTQRRPCFTHYGLLRVIRRVHRARRVRTCSRSRKRRRRRECRSRSRRADGEVFAERPAFALFQVHLGRGDDPGRPLHAASEPTGSVRYWHSPCTHPQEPRACGSFITSRASKRQE